MQRFSWSREYYWLSIKQKFNSLIFFSVCCLWSEEESVQRETHPFPVWMLCLCYPLNVTCSSFDLCRSLCCGITEEEAKLGKDYVEYLHGNKKNGPKEVSPMTI